MSPRTSKQFEEIRSEKRKIILDTAMELFANEGYHTTSISKIAKTANISKGLMYNYFESKVDLLKAIFIDATEKAWKYFDPNHDGVLTLDEFIYFISKSIQSVKENISYWKLYSSLMIQIDINSIINEDFKSHIEEYSKILHTFFSSNGSEDPEGDLLIFSSTLKGAIVQYVSAPEYFPIDIFEQKIVHYFNEKFNRPNLKTV